MNDTQNPQTTHAYACLSCAHKKVKCDRLSPCRNCSKSGGECVYRPPRPPQRRRRRDIENELLAKLNRYEGMLKKLGVEIGETTNAANKTPVAGNDVDADRSTPSSASAQLDETVKVTEKFRDGLLFAGVADNGRLVADRAKSRYLENNLWTSLSDEMRHPDEMLPESTDDEADTTTPATKHPPEYISNESSLLFGSPLYSRSLRDLHPTSLHVQKLWFVFRENVDPLIKLFHLPTKEVTILRCSTALDNLTRRTEAFMFAIYFFAVTSLDEEECLDQFGERRSLLLDRYQYATEQAMIRVGVLGSTDLVVLQAFVMYLNCMRPRSDSGTLWALTGTLLRIAQRGGLHRDGISLGVEPWSAEMRNRLWWQIVLLDGRTTELSGFGRSISAPLYDTKMPLNINDSDLDPSITSLPQERAGATEMMHCCICYEVGNFFRETRAHLGLKSNWKDFSTSQILAKKDAAIDELEQRLEDKFLKYCDPLNPLHQLCSITGRAVIATIRVMVHHPSQYTDKGVSLPQSERDMLFKYSLKILEYDNMAHTMKSLKKFRWSIQNYFPWHPVICLLGELRVRKTGGDADQAWDQLEELFVHRPEWFKVRNKPLHTVFGNLALKAWNARQQELERCHSGQSLPSTPAFIMTIQAQRATSMQNPSQEQKRRPAYKPDLSDTAGLRSSNGSDQSAAVNMLSDPDNAMFDGSGMILDPSPMDSSQWDDLIFQNFDYQPDADDAELFFGQSTGYGG